MKYKLDQLPKIGQFIDISSNHTNLTKVYLVVKINEIGKGPQKFWEIFVSQNKNCENFNYALLFFWSDGYVEIPRVGSFRDNFKFSTWCICGNNQSENESGSGFLSGRRIISKMRNRSQNENESEIGKLYFYLPIDPESEYHPIHLPNDVWLNIAARLSSDDLKHFNSTCRKFRSVCSHPNFWRFKFQFFYPEAYRILSPIPTTNWRVEFFNTQRQHKIEFKNN